MGNQLYFGKYKGIPLEEVPESYIQWCIREIRKPPTLMDQLSNELLRRKGLPLKSQFVQNETTHYLWTHPDGITQYWIPNDVSMVGTETESCPF